MASRIEGGGASGAEAFGNLANPPVKNLMEKFAKGDKISSEQREGIAKEAFKMFRKDRKAMEEMLDTNTKNDIPKSVKEDLNFYIRQQMLVHLERLNEKDRLIVFDHIIQCTRDGIKKIWPEKIIRFFINTIISKIDKREGLADKDGDLTAEYLFENILLSDKNRKMSLKENRAFFKYIIQKLSHGRKLNRQEFHFVKSFYSKKVYDFLCRYRRGDATPDKNEKNVKKGIAKALLDSENIKEYEREFLFHQIMKDVEEASEFNLTEYEKEINFLIEVFTSKPLDSPYTQPTGEQEDTLYKKLFPKVTNRSKDSFKSFVLERMLQKSKYSDTESHKLKSILPSLSKHINLQDIIKLEPEVIFSVMSAKLWTAKDRLNQFEKKILLRDITVQLLEGADLEAEKMEYLIDNFIDENGEFTQLFKIIGDRDTRLAVTSAIDNFVMHHFNSLLQRDDKKTIANVIDGKILLDDTEAGRAKLAEWETRRNAIKAALQANKTLGKAYNNVAFRTTTEGFCAGEEITEAQEKLLAIYYSPKIFYFFKNQEEKLQEKHYNLFSMRQLFEDCKQLNVEKILSKLGLDTIKRIPKIVKKALFSDYQFNEEEIRKEFYSEHVISVLKIYIEKRGNDWHTQLEEKIKNEEVRKDLQRELSNEFIKDMKKNITLKQQNLDQHERRADMGDGELISDITKKYVGKAKEALLAEISLKAGSVFKVIKGIFVKKAKKERMEEEKDRLLEVLEQEKNSSYNIRLYNNLEKANAAMQITMEKMSESERIPADEKEYYIKTMGDGIYGLIYCKNDLVKKRNELTRKIAEIKSKLQEAKIERGVGLGILHTSYNELKETEENIEEVQNSLTEMFKLFKVLKPPLAGLAIKERLQNLWKTVTGYFTFNTTNYTYEAMQELDRYASLGCASTKDLIKEAYREFGDVTNWEDELKKFKHWLQENPELAANMAGDVMLLVNALKSEDQKNIIQEIMNVMNTQIITHNLLHGISGVKKMTKDQARYLLLCRTASFVATAGTGINQYIQGGVLQGIAGVVKTEAIKTFTKTFSSPVKEQMMIVLQMMRGDNWKQIVARQSAYKLCSVTGELNNLASGRSVGVGNVIKDQFLKIKFAKTWGESTLRSIFLVGIPAIGIGAAATAAGAAIVGGLVGLGIVTWPISVPAAFTVASFFLIGTTFCAIAGTGGLVLLDHVFYPNSTANLAKQKRKALGEIVLDEEKINK